MVILDGRLSFLGHQPRRAMTHFQIFGLGISGRAKVRVLVQHGADVNWRPNKKKEPLLHSTLAERWMSLETRMLQMILVTCIRILISVRSFKPFLPFSGRLGISFPKNFCHKKLLGAAGAARFGHVPVIKSLLDSKAQLHQRLKGAGAVGNSGTAVLTAVVSIETYRNWWLWMVIPRVNRDWR